MARKAQPWFMACMSCFLIGVFTPYRNALSNQDNSGIKPSEEWKRWVKYPFILCWVCWFACRQSDRTITHRSSSSLGSFLLMTASSLLVNIWKDAEDSQSHSPTRWGPQGWPLGERTLNCCNLMNDRSTHGAAFWVFYTRQDFVLWTNEMCFYLGYFSLFGHCFHTLKFTGTIFQMSNHICDRLVPSYSDLCTKKTGIHDEPKNIGKIIHTLFYYIEWLCVAVGQVT